MKIRIHLSPRLPLVPALLILTTVLCLLLVVAIHYTPAPRIETTFGGASVEIAADRSWTLLPGQCATITWDLEGIQSVYVDGKGKVGHDVMAFCPKLNGTSLNLNITAVNGELRTFVLNINDLPSATLTWLTVLAILLPFLIAFYYLATMRLLEPIVLNVSPILALSALLLLCLLLQTVRPSAISSGLDKLGDVFRSRSWQLLGSVTAGLVFVPLATHLLRRGRKSGMRADLVAIGAFFVIVGLVYSVAGFESIAQYEIWPYRAYFEGRPSEKGTELLSRFWILVPHTLASVISPDSFAGYHLVNLFMLSGMLVFFYAIQRQLKVPPWLAFLATVLFLVYPVNSSLMSSRSFPHTFSKLSLLAAVFFMLDCRENSSRRHLLGIWLALLFNVGSYEMALVIILIIPLLWWWGHPIRIWRNVNLTLIWYLFPASKVAYVLLRAISDRSYYGTWYIGSATLNDPFTLDSVRYHLDIVATVYGQTFLYGWQEAVYAIGHNTWIGATAASLALLGIVTAYLARESGQEMFPARKKIATALLSGLLFILPSIGVLMWLGYLARGLWRMYVYVPIGAAVAMLGLVVLVSTAIKNFRLRKAFVVCLSLLLIVPALSRLFLQQRQFDNSANAKAEILMQIVEQVPYFNASARLMMVTSMSYKEIDEHGIDELRKSLLDSAIYMLYQEGRPKVAFLCVFGGHCSTEDIEIAYNFHESANDYADIVIFRLHDDLRVELLRELPPELRGMDIVNYDPDRLIDTSAPIPPRALTMLASARHT